MAVLQDGSVILGCNRPIHTGCRSTSRAIWSRRAQQRSFCPQSLRSFGRIENLQIASTAIENDDAAAGSICRTTAAPTSEAGKCEYLTRFL